MPTVKAAFFDVDGVLLDSLPQHLAYCRLKAQQYGLVNLHMPSPQKFRQLVSRGVPVSPMVNFFLAVGFSSALAERATRDYEEEFARRFPSPFPGVPEMLVQLKSAGLALGLITSNVRENVEPALSGVMRYFHPQCLFYAMPGATHRDKRADLLEGARVLALANTACAYVGDQPSDASAAHAAGVQFLGVSYGWGFATPVADEVVVDRIAKIPAALLDTSAASGSKKGRGGTLSR